MSKKPESRYIDKVHRQIKKLYPRVLITRMAMMPGSTAGIADFLYESDFNKHIWIEYKYIADLTTVRKLPVNKISPNQIKFLRDRIEHNIPCAVIFGDEKGLGYFIEGKNITDNLDNNTIDHTKIVNAITKPDGIASQIYNYISL